MKTSTIIASVLIAASVLSVWKPNLRNPNDIIDIDEPAASLRIVVGPIRKLLNNNGSRGQAGILATFYFEASETILRDSNHGRILKTKNHLRTFCERAATLRFQGIFKSVPGLADAIHGENGALAKIIGLEAGLLDHEKSANALHAIAWACQEAK